MIADPHVHVNNTGHKRAFGLPTEYFAPILSTKCYFSAKTLVDGVQHCARDFFSLVFWRSAPSTRGLFSIIDMYVLCRNIEHGVAFEVSYHVLGTDTIYKMYFCFRATTLVSRQNIAHEMIFKLML